MVQQNSYEETLEDWISDEKAAIELINLIGRLWFNKSVELILFRNKLFDRNSSQILKLHQYARNFVKQPITVQDTLLLAAELNDLHLAPARLDIGRLASEWLSERLSFNNDISRFVQAKMADMIGDDKINLKPKDVVLYGFGRIGRLAARELVEQAGRGEQLRLRAIVTRDKKPEDLIKRAALLENDSVHGPFSGTIIEDVEKQQLIINGHTVQFISANNPEDIDYTKYGINDALLIDNTGVYRDREALSRHLKAKGIEKVLLTAPAKGDVPNIVLGVNQQECSEGETIFSAASCTTNAIGPILSAITQSFTIEKGHVETIHSYTNDQNLLDNFHKKYRRGRSAAVNMVITETGADKAISKVISSLTGKFTGNAIRVPTPNGSLAILNLTIAESTTKEAVNELIKKAALKGALVEQIQYSMSNELVSTDIVSSPHPSVFDSPATIVSNDGKTIILYVWYDNEFGYTHQVIRLAKYLSNVIRLRYY